MKEVYRGYTINIEWDWEQFGYTYIILDENNVEVAYSVDVYFFIKCALTDARAEVNILINNSVVMV